MVDKNLFLYDLSVVAIMKFEAPYLKEWLDYHLAAGVDHFYLYDNGSPDNQSEVVRPYVEAGLVDYFSIHGKLMQMFAYNDAIKNFKFLSRYMAFIDLDEFIFPKSNRSVVEVVDEVLSRNPNAAALGINWQCFGSNGQEAADYSRGVLERFTQRAPSDWTPDGGGNAHIKTIANPRMINTFLNPHFPFYLAGVFCVNENGGEVPEAFNAPVMTDKIVVNHYHTKSREEYLLKRGRGRADILGDDYDDAKFNAHDRNEIFDDGILKYRASRTENFPREGDEQRLARLTYTLKKNLSGAKISVEAALACRALSTYLREKFPDDDIWKFCELSSLSAVLRSLNNFNVVDLQLFLRELPNLLSLPYAVVKELSDVVTLKIVPQIMNAGNK